MDNTIKYSVDMVRLRVKVHKDFVENFNSKFLAHNPNVEFYETYKMKGFRENWRITQLSIFENQEDFSFWMGYRHNSERASNKYYLTLEYNPNKCMEIGLLGEIINRFFCTIKTQIVSCDIACDVEGVNIRDVVVDKLGKQCKKTFDYGGDNITYYLGSGIGRIKIYNKAREQGLKNVDLTRYEVSISIKEDIWSMQGFYYEGTLSPLYLKDSHYSGDETLQAILYAVEHGYNIEDLSRRYKEKVRDKFLHKKIDINNKKIADTVCDWCQLFIESHDFRI